MSSGATATLDTQRVRSRRRTSFARLIGASSVAHHDDVPAVETLALLDEADLTPAEAVDVLFRHILQRRVTSQARAPWVAALAQGRSLLDLALEIAASPEAQARPPALRTQVAAQLRTWTEVTLVRELGLGSPIGLGYRPGLVGHEIYVDAVFEAALSRQPTPAEREHEVRKLADGAGREWLLRAFAQRPDVRRRILGDPGPGIRGRFALLRHRRDLLPSLRAMVLAAESRRLALLGDRHGPREI